MQIRVPAERYDSAIAAVAATGKVRERSESAQDLTGDIADSIARLSQVREQIQMLETDAAPASELASAWQSAVRALVQTTVALASAFVWLAVFAPYALIVGAIGAVVFRRRVRA